MWMTIRYPKGLRVEAVLLAAGRDRMRVVVPSRRDAIELHRVDAEWFTEEEIAIEIESLVPLAEGDISAFCTAVYPLTHAVGRSFPVI